MIYLGELNPQQREAAETTEGPLLILAGAGSGKTRTITYRIAHMVSNLGISGKNILGISFTNKAAKEMRERVSALLGSRLSRSITLCTFHSLGLRLLKKECQHLGYSKALSIYDTSDQSAIIREALKAYQAEKSFDRQEILGKIGRLKNLGVREEEFVNSPYFDPENPYDLACDYCYRFYQDRLKFMNAIDFDDILYLTVKLFKLFPELAKKYSEQYRYIMVDEYQDTNPLQFELITSLVGPEQNLAVVGDDDQAIYGFRGADVRNILEFEKHFPNAKVIKLEENYRSNHSILTLANQVIKESKNRREKSLWSKKEAPHKPLLWATGSSEHEAQIVVEDILKHQSQGEHLGNIAILYRSKTQVQMFEDELRLSCVPYTIVGGQKLYEKKEVKDLIGYLSFIHNPKDEMALRRILNVPSRGIGTATLEKFVQKSQERQSTLYQIMQELPEVAESRSSSIVNFCQLITTAKEKFNQLNLPDALTWLVQEIDYNRYIEKSYDQTPKQGERRKADIVHFIQSANRFYEFHKQHATLSAFVEKLMLQDSQDKQEEEGEDDDLRPNQVTLMTLHSAKGLEFDIVYFVGIEEELLPHKKTVREGSDLDEERRLCYVGITRAREKLVLTYCKQRKIYGKDVPRHPSRFVMEAKELEHLTHQDRTSFGHLTEDEAKAYKKEFFSNLLSQEMDDL